MVVEKSRVKVSKKNPSIERIEKRCIHCGMCMNVCENLVGIDHKNEKEALCVNCGQCIMNCPVGALMPKFNYKTILNLLHDTDKILAISVAPAVRVSLGVEFGLEDGIDLESILPSIMRRLGFKYVFDVTFGADVTIMEEASELLKRVEEDKHRPLFTSCCPAWVKFASHEHPEVLDNLSTSKSPIGMQSTLIKKYFKELNNIKENIISVVVAPCTAKKAEIIDSDTDYVITTQELAMMMRECNIDLNTIKPSEFDKMLNTGSMSGRMFGRSGGVAEAVLNTLYYFITNKDAPKNYFRLSLKEGITISSFKIKDKIVTVAVICGLKNLESFLRAGEYADLIEVMSCPGGCIGGGGQPLIQIQKLKENREKRTNSLNNSNSTINYAYQNSEIIDLYNYIGKSLGKKAMQLLHKKHTNLKNDS